MNTVACLVASLSFDLFLLSWTTRGGPTELPPASSKTSGVPLEPSVKKVPASRARSRLRENAQGYVYTWCPLRLL